MLRRYLSGPSLFLVLLLAPTAGCGKDKPTAPPDPYAAMYGTYNGQIVIGSNSYSMMLSVKGPPEAATVILLVDDVNCYGMVSLFGPTAIDVEGTWNTMTAKWQGDRDGNIISGKFHTTSGSYFQGTFVIAK